MRCPIDKTAAVGQIALTFLLCSCMLIHSGFVNKKNATQSLTAKLSRKIIYCYDNRKLYIEGDLWWWVGQNAREPSGIWGQGEGPSETGTGRPWRLVPTPPPVPGPHPPPQGPGTPPPRSTSWGPVGVWAVFTPMNTGRR